MNFFVLQSHRSARGKENDYKKKVGVKRKANSQNTQNDLMAWHVLVNTRTERTLQYLYRGDKGDICGKGGGKGEEAAAQR